MIFNGHTIETVAEIDDVTMANIQTMYADGMVGNYGLLSQMATLTNGVFNYMRPANTSPYKLANILGNAYDYIYPPLPEDMKKMNAEIPTPNNRANQANPQIPMNQLGKHSH